MNVNNNIPNNPINASATRQQNAPVDAPNIQQVAANQAPQGIDQAPAAGDIDDDIEMHDEMEFPRQVTTSQITVALANGRTYDAIMIFNKSYYCFDFSSAEIRDLAKMIAQAWNNGDQDFGCVGGALAAFGDFYCNLDEEPRNTVLRIIAEKQDLDADFRREAIEKFMPDNHPDKAELLCMCDSARFYKTKSARK